MEAQDKVVVGDLDSSARGSGARKNAGKPQWWQLPVFALEGMSTIYHVAAAPGIILNDVIADIARWQRLKLRPEDSATVLNCAISRLMYLLADEQKILHGKRQIPLRALESTVRVLEFGAVKYKPGNWAKGMPWSVCFSCAISHLFAATQGELNDQESGLSHLAHAMCNLLFLKSYEKLFPEGDDRLTEWAIPPDPERDENNIDHDFDTSKMKYRSYEHPAGENI